VSVKPVKGLVCRPPPVTCDGEIAIITSTPVDDDFFGTLGRDVIAGLDGFDVIDGGGGNDLFCGGWDQGQINARAGSDRVFCDEPNIEGGDPDQIDGGSDSDLSKEVREMKNYLVMEVMRYSDQRATNWLAALETIAWMWV